MAKPPVDTTPEATTPDTGSIIDIAKFNAAIESELIAAIGKEVETLFRTDQALKSLLKRQAVTAIVQGIVLNNNVEAIIAAKLAEQFVANFDSSGLASSASKRELTLMDNMVVVEETLTAKNVDVVDTMGTTHAVVNGTLTVNGAVDVSTTAWDGLATKIKDDLITELDAVINASVKAQADSINFTEITLDGAPVLSGSTLGSRITDSSLTSVGTLDSLQVTGTSDINAIHVEHKRVGINTKAPSSALAIWDDEVEVIAGKFKAQTAFIGTNRTQDLVIGVGRRDDITIGIDGTTTIKKLKIGQRSIAHGNTIPGYAGTAGDLVLNTALTPANPIFAWYCMHDYSWVPLKATI